MFWFSHRQLRENSENDKNKARTRYQELCHEESWALFCFGSNPGIEQPCISRTGVNQSQRLRARKSERELLELFLRNDGQQLSNAAFKQPQELK